MTEEIWKWIDGYEDKYEVSTFGNVKSHLTNRLVSTYNNLSGYKVVRLHNDGTMKRYLLHRLVAITFIPTVEGKPEVNHIDRDKLNNHISNLEWADDFIQNLNRDCVLNAKQYCVSCEKPNRPSSWRLRWKEEGKSRSKYFKSEGEARQWAVDNLNDRKLDKLNKPRERKSP